MTETPETVLEFWFSELTPKQWFVKEDAIDRQIAERFTIMLSPGPANAGDRRLPETNPNRRSPFRAGAR